MKKLYFIISCFLYLVFFSSSTKAQCTGGNLGGAITPTTSWQSVGTTNINGNRYFTFVAAAGFNYYFSFCSVDGGSSTYDTELTILDNSGNPVAGGYNDDNCGSQSYLNWTCVTAGTYRVLVTKYSCANQANIGTFVYKMAAPLSCPSGLGGGTIAVASLPYASGAGTTCGKGNDLNSSNVTSCGSSFYLGGEDMVWVFTPAITGTVTINLTSSGSYNGLMLYDGCPLNGQGGSCVQVSQSSAGNQAITACLTGGRTYYLILDVFPSPNCNPFTNLTISAPIAVGGCALGTGVNNITLPYSSTGRTTCGKVDDITSASAITCGSTLYYTGEDEVFVFTPSVTGNISIVLNSSGSYTGITLFDGCPSTASCSGTAGTCVAYEQSSTGSKSLCANVTAGHTYYLVIDSWSTPTCNPYDISITAPVALLPGATCGSPVNIASLPYSASNETTACMGNDYTNASLGSCGTLYESGEDKVYAYTASGAECIGITINGSSTNSIGYQVYSGCPGSAGATCITGGGGANSGTLTGSIILPAAGTYYIIVDTWATPNNAQYNITLTSFGAGATNDLPCNATPLILGIPYSGANNCSGGAGEPAAPACWVTPNTINTVWYSVQAPASGQLRVRVIPNSLTNPQVAVYSGTCGNAMPLVGCNDDAVSCGTTTNYSCDLNLTGLTSGANYFIAVDGYAGLTGTFSVLAMDGTQALTPLNNGQDCGIYLPVCDTSMSFGDPGFQSFGNICDFPGGGTNCLLSGERSSVWFEIPINANGNLAFSIVPKDWPGAPSTVGTDYDFAVWKTVGAGAVTCSAIAAGSTPVSCNYNFLGVTGCYGNVVGAPPPAYPGFGSSFNTAIPVVAGETYVLVVSNFTNSTSGFDIIFGNTAPVNYSATGTRSTWSGGIDTDWFKSANWGGCPVPTCSRDAIINGGIVIQPTVAAAGATCKTLTINPGATLTLNAGLTLSVCEHFINYGGFTASPTSTVLFGNAAVNQNMDGNLTVPNAFGNLTVTKTGGMVTMLQNTDAKGNLSITNATSSFTMNTKNLKVGGNFSNVGTFIPSTGVLEFNGVAPQTYSNTGLAGAEVGKVKMNHSSTGLTLLSNMTINTGGSLDLTLGKIVTNAFEVAVKNRAVSAVTTGNGTSFVQGFLRRYLFTQGSYDFPVGEATKGYQRMNLNFNNPSFPTSIDNIVTNFLVHPVLPIALGITECGATYSSPALNNGYWNPVASATPNSGQFDITLYNTNYTNAANRWTIQTNNSGSWVAATGSCVVSPVTAVQRLAVTGIAPFSTAQGPSPLAIDFVNISAEAVSNAISLNWNIYDVNGLLGFDLLRSTNGIDYERISWIDALSGVQNNGRFGFNNADYDVESNVLYFYKVKSISSNGQEKYSAVVSASIAASESRINLFPNPLTGSSVLTTYLKNDVNLKVELTDLEGRLIKVLCNKQCRKGLQELTIVKDDLNLTPGLYFLKVSEGESIAFVKLLVADK
ncbi:MAG TPA: T9SS type A sorting domain-containing protein [Bacteroidia bacterium]|nr:T9SS type A sorting domain-containing protein [Bacteroidia bacterium]